MIIEYHRPDTAEEAYGLLSRLTPRTIPLGGGTMLSRRHKGDVAVVDFQNLGLDSIQPADGRPRLIGATTRLQTLYDHTGSIPALRSALVNEGGLNFRNQATVAGAIVSCDGRSALVTALLAMNAQLVWYPDNSRVSLGDYLALRDTWEAKGFIQAIELPTQGKLHLEIVARTPADRPIVCAAVMLGSSRQTRIALGGFGSVPVLAMDGPSPVGADLAARSAYIHAGDVWASAEYRSQTAGALVHSMLEKELGGK